MKEPPDALAVEFYTRAGVIAGYVFCPTDVRLLDLLNGSAVPDRTCRGNFIGFVESTGSGNTHREKPGEFLRKSAISLVAISDPNLGRGFGASGRRNAFPFVQKTPVRVSLQLPEYSLLGTLHLDLDQSTLDLLNQDTLFLPLTEVTIARDYHLYGTRPFVAVNREHIISCKEEVSGWIPERSFSLSSQ